MRTLNSSTWGDAGHRFTEREMADVESLREHLGAD